MNDYKNFIKSIENENHYTIKVKGTDVGKPNAFNYSLIIIKKALVNYFVKHKSIYDTINENQKLIDYQIVKKRTNKTKYIIRHANEDKITVLPDKVLRLFPVIKGGVLITTDTFKQVPEVPKQSIIVKDNILNLTINDIPNFDINYYINAFNDKLDQWMNGPHINEII